MDTFLNIVVILALASVLATLGMGLFTMTQSGDKARARSNALMRWRVKLQFAAIAVILLVAIIKSQSG